VNLTAEGRHLASEIVQYRRENMARLLKNLPERDQERLVGLLERVVSFVTEDPRSTLIR
jgi:DNA-binding MarR family transcriptional regulator